jgi:dTDP-4-amino-4,6-dideoxygalactose transaminase
MKRVIGPRASTILYNTLVANSHKLGNGHMLLPANICPIVPVTLLKAGVQFSFIDIDATTQCMNLDLLWKELSKPSCKGVLFVHSYGNTQATFELFKEIRCKRDELFLIDDRCIDIPLTQESSQNSLANLNLYSTGYAKFVEFGYGGFGYLSDDTSYHTINAPYSEVNHSDLIIQMNHSIQSQQPFEYYASNWLEYINNLDERSYFERIEAQIPVSRVHKDSLNAIYMQHLPKEIQMPIALCQWRFNLQVENKAELLKAIFDAGLFASSHYASVSNIFSDKYSPVAEAAHARMLNLFNDHRFTTQKAKEVCEIITIALN